MSPPAKSSALRAAEPWLPLIVVVLAGILLASHLNQGWIPYDEGALGQAAERVLSGQVPHRDYDEIYTGGLAYLHAVFFSIGSHASSTLRLPLFLLALPWVAAMYGIARRFVPPAGAALVALTAFVWSVPNYPAAVPSWFNVFFATFGALALLHGLESGGRQWMVLAGTAGGISVLFGASGVFYLLGGAIALIATSLQSRPGGVSSTARPRSGAALVAVILIFVMVAVAVPIARAGTREIVRFLLPIGAVVAALIWREWKYGVTTALDRGRGLWQGLGPFSLGALAPLIVYSVLLIWEGALVETIDGVFMTAFRRSDSVVIHPPPPIALIYAAGIGALLAGWVRGAATPIAIAAAAVFGAVIDASGENPKAYGIGLLAAWGLPFLAAAGSAWLLTTRSGNTNRSIDAVVVITTIACATLFLEFPDAAPRSLLYAMPLSIVALAAVVRVAGHTPFSLQLVVLGFLLLFGAFRVIPGSVESFGVRFVETDETVRLKLERGGLRVSAPDAERYESLIGAVQVLARDRTLWAGPDSPEIYFLSGVPNRTRTLFDFLDGPARQQTVPLLDRVRAAGATMVVLNLRPAFSAPPNQATVEALQSEFPNVRTVQGFLVFWR